jgi:hypothetical protein
MKFRRSGRGDGEEMQAPLVFSCLLSEAFGRNAEIRYILVGFVKVGFI